MRCHHKNRRSIFMIRFVAVVQSWYCELLITNLFFVFSSILHKNILVGFQRNQGASWTRRME